MSFIKKNFICKKKFGTVAKVKVKLVPKIKKHNQLHFGTLVSRSYCYCGNNSYNTDFFQKIVFKERNKMADTKS